MLQLIPMFYTTASELYTNKSKTKSKQTVGITLRQTEIRKDRIKEKI